MYQDVKMYDQNCNNDQEKIFTAIKNTNRSNNDIKTIEYNQVLKHEMSQMLLLIIMTQ